MQLESHATPFGDTPQQRYATLHRAIERGLDSDEIWQELAEISLKLGHANEAVRCVRRMQEGAARMALESRLARLGLTPAPAGAHGHPAAPRGAPAASSAGPGADAHPESPRLVDHLLDAVQYLTHQHMPWLVLTTMLAFPLIVGVGGFLTAGGSIWMLAAIAALPGLCVLAVIAAMGHQILLTSSEGVGDVPNIPGFGLLVTDARRFAADIVMVGGMFFGPPLVVLALGGSWSTLPLFALGALFAPITFALRQVRRDLSALAPLTWVRGVARAGRGYPAMAAVAAAAFLPAAATGYLVANRAVWVQIALVGPLSVLPVFLVARLLGTWLDARREAFGDLLPRTEQAPVVEPSAVADAKPAPRQPRRPEALERFAAPQAMRAAAEAKQRTAKATRTGQPAPSPARTPPASAGRPAKAVVEGRRPAGKHTTTASASEPAAARRPRTRKPALQDPPDLSGMPGALVVSGAERSKQGAAAERRR